MPGKDGKTICFYKAKSKFRVRYSTFGFQPDAKLDDGDMCATEFAVIALSPRVEQRITELVKKAAGGELATDWGAIEVRGARENNLRDVALDIPKRRLVVFTG